MVFVGNGDPDLSCAFDVGRDRIREPVLRGFGIGGAQVSEKHCGFVVNKGGATSQDVIDVIRHVQKTVLEDSGVKLETEVILLGDFE